MNNAYHLGFDRGLEDVHAEADEVSVRIPTHAGLIDQPPADLNGKAREEWIDDFLAGYGNARAQALRGEAA